MKSKKIENAVDKVINGLVATLEQAKGFALEHAPDVAKQMVARRGIELKWETASGFGFSAGTAALLAICACVYPSTSKDMSFICGFVGFCAASVSLINLYCGITSLKELSMLRVAPKVFLLEELRRMKR